MSEGLIPGLATLVSVIFTLAVARQYHQRRKPHQLLWAVGFGMFTIGVAAEFASEVWGWRGWLYRLYYFDTALLVAVLGAGTLYLIRRDRQWVKLALVGGGATLALGLLLALLISGSLLWGAVAVLALGLALAGGLLVFRSTCDTAPAYLAFLLVLAAGFGLAALSAPLQANLLVPGHTVGGEAMPGQVRMFSVLFTIPGTFFLIGGACYSWWVTFRREARLIHSRSYNLFIAAGALVVAGSGGLARAGNPDYLYPGELVGLVLMLVGFYKSRPIARGGNHSATPRNRKAARG